MTRNPEEPYDAILVVGFGGPEKREDVIPFLENVLRGKNVPHARLLHVAEHQPIGRGRQGMGRESSLGGPQRPAAED